MADDWRTVGTMTDELGRELTVAIQDGEAALTVEEAAWLRGLGITLIEDGEVPGDG